MCGRFSQAMTLDKLVKRFGFEAEERLDLKPRYNLAPTQKAVVILPGEDGSPKPMMITWGLIPPWSKGDKFQPIVNLRSETLLGRPAFKRFLQNSRCIVPADG